MQTFTGIQYLMIDIASNFGLDKSSWKERLEWFALNEHQLDNLVQQADEPALFYAGVQAFKKAKAGQPIGYPISLDATSSGLQILAALTGDRQAASICNVIDTGSREDAYTSIYQQMLARTGGAAKISRDDTKQAIMTALYGSTAMPKAVFGEGALLQVFFNTMSDNAPGAWELNQAMLGFWDPTAVTYDWVMPDNFHVHTKVMDRVTETVNFLEEPFEVHHMVNQPIEQGRSLGANMVHSIDGMIVREMVRRCDYNRNTVSYVTGLLRRTNHVTGPLKTGSQDDQIVSAVWDAYNRTGYLSARILDHLNASNIHHVDPLVIMELITSLPDKPFTVIPIHDCFRCLPHYGNDLRMQYNRQLSMIAKSTLLEDLLTQITGRHIAVGKLDEHLWIDILRTNYALS